MTGRGKSPRTSARRGAGGPLCACLLVPLAALLALPVQAQTTSDLPLITTMTVGADGDERGYNSVNGSYGSMVDDDFTFDGTSYQIRRLRVDEGSDAQIRLSANPGASPSLVLEWAGETLPLNDVTSTSLSGSNRTFHWSDTWRTNNAPSLNDSSYKTTLTTGNTVNVCIRTTMQSCVASTDATLSALAVKDGAGDAVALSPAFASTTTSYAATVKNRMDRVTFEPTKGDDDAGVQYFDADDTELSDAAGGVAGFQADLDVGANTIKVKVTAEDSDTTETYTVTVTREAAATGYQVWSELMTVGEVDKNRLLRPNPSAWVHRRPRQSV